MKIPKPSKTHIIFERSEPVEEVPFEMLPEMVDIQFTMDGIKSAAKAAGIRAKDEKLVLFVQKLIESIGGSQNV